MKKTACILFILFQCSFLFSQRIRKITVKSPELQAYIENTAALDTISFTYASYTPLELTPDTVLFKLKYGQPYDDTYKITYTDHRYLFEKQFGPFPDTAFKRMIDWVEKIHTPCDYYWLEGKITGDGITIQIHEACPEKGDDVIFMKVENPVEFIGDQDFVKETFKQSDPAGFQNGPAGLEKYISQSIPVDVDWAKNNPNDSVLYYRVVIKRDSLAYDVKQMDGSNSVIENYIRKAIERSRPWKPLYHGGRLLNAYIYVYIILHKDGTLRVGYSGH